MAVEKTKLDRSRSYGVIYGNPAFAFEQDGVHFSSTEEVVEQWSSLDRIAAERTQAQKRKDREAQLARARQIAEARRKAREDD